MQIESITGELMATIQPLGGAFQVSRRCQNVDFAPWVFESIEDATGHAELFCNLLAISGSNSETIQNA